jgi:hypothetical protein
MKLQQKTLFSFWVVLCSVITLTMGVLAARAADDNENSTPTAWWTYFGQS